MPFPKRPEKIVPFNSGPVAPHDIGRQFDEHSRSISDIIDFLRTIVRDDGALRQLEALRKPSLRSGGSIAPLPTGVLGPNVGGPFGVDDAGASATAQDWSQVSIEWAEHMPDTIPPNILAMKAMTGEHWSARWWATRAAGAAGMLAWWYMGAWPDPGPPTTPFTDTGEPIPVGAMYWNTTHNVLMIWNGSAWVSTLPGTSKTVTQSLYYHATAGQTVFPLTTLDLYNHTFTYNQTVTEGTQVIVAGDRVEPSAFGVNTVNSVITLAAGVPAGTLLVFDILTPPSQFSAGICLVNPIPVDGSTATFHGLTIVSGGTAVNATRSEDLWVSIDGVIQEPVIDYTAFGDAVTFTAPPTADAVVFMIFFGPVASGGGGGGGGTGVIISATPPVGAAAGQLWFDDVGGQLYIYYNDGTSSQWVIVTNEPGVAGPAGAAGGAGPAGPSGPGLIPAPVAPPIVSAWTQRNFVGSTVATDVANGVNLTVGATASSTNVLRALTVPAPATPYTIDLNYSFFANPAGSGYFKTGCLWFDGTKAQVLTTQLQYGSSGPYFSVETYNNLSSYNAVPVSNSMTWLQSGVWMRMRDDGTNVSVYGSGDGITWALVYTTTKAAGWLGASGYTNVGWFINEQVLGNGGALYMTLKSWWVH